MKKFNKIMQTSSILVLAGSMLVGCSSSGSSSKTTSTWDKIKSSGTITFGTEGIYSPFSYHDSKKKLVGYDVEVARAIAKQLGLKAKFTEIKWDGLIAGLDAKKFDAITNEVSITAERSKKYLFSTPYSYSYGSLIVRSDETKIKSFNDLKGVKDAQSASSNWTAVAKKYGATLTTTDGFTQDIQLLQQKRVDATVNDSINYLDYKKKQPNAKIKVAATSKDVTRSAVLIRQGDKEVQTQINKALKTLLKNGTITKISKKYFGEDISKAK
jgi:cystine transport system substrate-binding protein